ncbi:hypothetical protein AB6Q56_01475 [Dechloromonas sp. ARDL1]|uniref:hypothetical protein n=1 Tax=Dechloromonas sp. ARDL1 TaxID=3322121 RepID=UPI003DA75256
MSQKIRLTVVAALLALNVASLPAHAHAEHGKPQFGGVVAEAGEAQFEIVGQGNKVVVHASSHGAPVDMAGAKGKLTVLAGSAKSEVALTPVAPNRLEGAGSLPSGAKLLILVEWPGRKPLQARAVAP